MTSGNAALIAIGCFGLGLSVGLTVLLLASRGALQFLTALNPWFTRGFVAALGLASIATLLIINRAPTPGQALAARLASNGGSDADWNLLAQSYEFLGRNEDAQLARQHKVSAQRSLLDAMAATAPVRPVASMPSAMPSTPVSGGVGALLARAEDHRRKREFRQACDVYRQIVAAGGMTADSWADYADALASASPGGSLAGEPAKALEQALKLDPKQTKALWLKASLAHEQHRYEEALTTWRALLALMPPGSSDARIIEVNIAEAQRLAGKKG